MRKLLGLLLIYIFFCNASVYKFDIKSVKKLINYKSAIDLRDDDAEKSKNAEQRFIKGIRQFRKKKYNSAIHFFHYSLMYSKSLKTRINAYVYLGHIFRALNNYKQSTIYFLNAEELWKKEYMKGSIVDDKSYSTGVLSRIYKQIYINLKKMNEPTMAAIFAWASLRDKEINDPYVTVKNRKLFQVTGSMVDMELFSLFFKKMRLLKKTYQVKYFRSAQELNKTLKRFIEAQKIKLHIFFNPHFYNRIAKPITGDLSDVYEVFYSNNQIVGYIFHSSDPITKEAYTFERKRLVTSLVEFCSYNTTELRIKYNSDGSIRFLVIINESLQQPFYKFIPHLEVYRFKY